MQRTGNPSTGRGWECKKELNALREIPQDVGRCLNRLLWRVSVQSQELWPGPHKPRSSSLLSRSPLPLPLNTTTDGHFMAITVRRKPTRGLELEHKQLHGTNCIKESKVSISKTEPKTYLARIEYFLLILETFVERQGCERNR